MAGGPSPAWRDNVCLWLLPLRLRLQQQSILRLLPGIPHALWDALQEHDVSI